METFTLEQAYYIGELIGVLVIVMSLIFVALQIRQNTRTMLHDARSAMRERIFNFQLMMAQQENLADIWHRGNGAFESLNELEQKRFLMIYAYEFSAWSEAYSSFQEGMLTSSFWDSMKIAIKEELECIGARKYWEHRKHWYVDSFQVIINDLMQEGSVE